jgi:hypothetical protein
VKVLLQIENSNRKRVQENHTLVVESSDTRNTQLNFQKKKQNVSFSPIHANKPVKICVMIFRLTQQTLTLGESEEMLVDQQHNVAKVLWFEYSISGFGSIYSSFCHFAFQTLVSHEKRECVARETFKLSLAKWLNW